MEKHKRNKIPFKKDTWYIGIHVGRKLKKKLNKETYSILLADQKDDLIHWETVCFTKTRYHNDWSSSEINPYIQPKYNNKSLRDILNEMLQADSVVQPGRIICKNKPQMS